MKNIDISICMVSYNHENYICKAIDSILSQKCKYSIEIIIGDDCSTDGTVDVIRKNYGNKVRLITRKKNLGLSKNMYDIYRRARGKVIYSLAGDDWIIGENTVERCFEILENKPEVSCVSGWTLVHNRKEEIIDVVKNTNIEGYTLENYLWGEAPRCAMICYRNTFAKDRDTYLFKCARNNEEMAYWIYLLEKGYVYILQECIHGYRYRADDEFNYNSTHDTVDIFCDNYMAIKRLQKRYKIEYEYEFLIDTWIYTVFVNIKKISDSKARKKMSRRAKKIITIRDYVNYLKCLPVLTVFHGYFPKKFRRLVKGKRKIINGGVDNDI